MPSNKLKIENIKTSGYAGERYCALMAEKDEISINDRINNLAQIAVTTTEFMM